MIINFFIFLSESLSDHIFECWVAFNNSSKNCCMTVKILFFTEFAFRSESAGSHEDSVDEKHSKGVWVVFVAEDYFDEFGLIFPNFAKFVVYFLGTQVFLARSANLRDLGLRLACLVSLRRSQSWRMGSGLTTRCGISWFFSLSFAFFIIIALSFHEKYFVGSLFFDLFADLFTIFVGTFLLAKRVQQFDILTKKLNRSWSWYFISFLFSIFDIRSSNHLGIIESILTSFHFLDILRFFSFW